MIARKTVSHHRERDFVFIKKHVRKVTDIDADQLQEIADFCNMEDDPEDAFLKFGAAIDFDYCLAFFDVDEFYSGIKEYLREQEDEEMIERYQPLLEALCKYSGYTIYLDE